MQETINKELVKFAVQRAITCKGCDSILDVDDAVLIEIKGSTSITCTSCAKRVLEVFRGGHLVGVEEVSTITGLYGVEEIHDQIYGQPEKSEASIEGEQLELI